jgi:hypothetical protein
MTRFGSAENKPDVMACNTFGLIRVVLTYQTMTSSQRLLTLCSAGTVIRLNATFISRMSQDLPCTLLTSSASCLRNWLFRRADGLLRDGHFKSLLL